MPTYAKCNIPAYGAVFYDEQTLLVAGGGGQGSHGVLNKVMVFDVTDTSVELVSQYILPEGSDSAASIAVAEDKTVFVGVNLPKSNGIDHLLKLKLNDERELVLEKAYNFFHAKDISIYQKATCVSGSMVACVSSSPTGLVSVLSESDDVLNISFDAELADAAFSEYTEKEQKFLAAASDSEIEIRSISQPNVKCVPSVPAPKGGRWTRIVSVRPGIFVAAATLPRQEGVQLSVIEVEGFGEAKVSSTVKTTAFPSVTALTTDGDRVAVGSVRGDVFVYDLSEEDGLVLGRKFRYAHTLPVTALALGPKNTVVSASMDGSIVLNENIDGRDLSIKSTLAWTALACTLIVLIAIAFCLVLMAEKSPYDAPGSTQLSGGEPSLVHSDPSTDINAVPSDFAFTGSPTDYVPVKEFPEVTAEDVEDKPTPEAEQGGQQPAEPTPESSIVAEPPNDGEVDEEVETAHAEL